MFYPSPSLWELGKSRVSEAVFKPLWKSFLRISISGGSFHRLQLSFFFGSFFFLFASDKHFQRKDRARIACQRRSPSGATWSMAAFLTDAVLLAL